jgi:hypothetical protein
MMKRLLLTFTAVFALIAQAQSERQWAIVDETGGQTVLMTNVSFLLASDYDDVFVIVCKDGTEVGGVKRASFKQVDPTGVKAPEHVAGRLLVADGALLLKGCEPGMKAVLYDASGKPVSVLTIEGSEASADISGLPAGVYVLRAGKAAVKFVKR